MSELNERLTVSDFGGNTVVFSSVARQVRRELDLADVEVTVGHLAQAVAQAGGVPEFVADCRYLGPKREPVAQAAIEEILERVGPLDAFEPEPEETFEKFLFAAGVGEEILLGLTLWLVRQPVVSTILKAQLLGDQDFVAPLARLVLGVVRPEIGVIAAGEAAKVLEELLADDRVVGRLLERQLEVLRQKPYLLAEFQRHFGG